MAEPRQPLRLPSLGPGCNGPGWPQGARGLCPPWRMTPESSFPRNPNIRPLLTITQMVWSVSFSDMAKRRGESACQRWERHQWFSKWVSQSAWGPPQGRAGSDHLSVCSGSQDTFNCGEISTEGVWGPNMNVGRQMSNPMQGRTGQTGTRIEQKMFHSKWRLQGHMAGMWAHP